MGLLVGTRRALLELAIAVAPEGYLLRIPFTAANQGYTDGQVIDTAAEGVLDGSATIVEADGTLAIVSNELVYTAQALPTWGEQGWYGASRARALGRALLLYVNIDQTTKESYPGWRLDASISDVGADRGYCLYFSPTATTSALSKATVIGPAGAYASATEYRLALILGGFDSNGAPFYSGRTKTDYQYGCWFMIKGGAFATWTLLWADKDDNDTPLYPFYSIRDGTGKADDFIVPDVDLSTVQEQINNYSSFGAANGTSLDAITPEVGNVWVEVLGDWDIQGNEAENDQYPNEALATIETGLADCHVGAKLTIGTGGSFFPGFVLRYVDSSNYWILLLSDNNNNFALWEKTAGVSNQRAVGGLTINEGTTYDLVVTLDDETITCFVDGAARISYAGAAANKTATRHGLRGSGSGAGPTTKCSWKDFYALPPTDADYDSVLDAV